MASPEINLQHVFTLAGLELKPFGMLSGEEVEQVWHMRNHPDIARWMGSGGNISLEQHRNFMARQKAERTHFNYLSHDPIGPVGVISLHRLDWQNRVAWLGIYRNPLRTGKGLGAHLLRAVCQLAFEIAQLHTLKLEVVADNSRAIAAYQRAGFSEEGCWREAIFRQEEDRYLDLRLMGITEQEWRSK